MLEANKSGLIFLVYVINILTYFDCNPFVVAMEMHVCASMCSVVRILWSSEQFYLWCDFIFIQDSFLWVF